MAGTHEDAQVILRLYELRREEKMRMARDWFAREFSARTMEELARVCPAGSAENAYYRMVVTYWEMAASFVANGVVNERLFFQANNTELLLVWERVKELVPVLRESQQNPIALRNLEKVAGLFFAYLHEEAGPAMVEAMQKRFRKA